MRLEKLRQVDLNLLITFAAIAEEKSITAAASRLLLSQPAVSRALQRARAMFGDALLVRSPHGFELTVRGRKILHELESYQRWSIWLRRICSIPSTRRVTSAFPALTMFVPLCFRGCVGDTQTDVTKCSLNFFHGRAALRS